MEGHVPTLEELLRLSKGKIRLLIELKAVSGKEREILVDQILALIEKYDFEKDCILMSLDFDLIHLVRQKNPSLKTGCCMFGNLGETTVENLLSLDCDFVVIEEKHGLQQLYLLLPPGLAPGICLDRRYGRKYEKVSGYGG